MHGAGRHIRDVEPQDVEKALQVRFSTSPARIPIVLTIPQFWYLAELFYVLCSGMLKIALGIFLLRVALKKAHIWIIRVVMLGTVVFGTTYFFLMLLQCNPISQFWMVSPGSSKCMNPKIITYTTYTAAGVTALADWTFGILPIFIVWDLKMPRKSKIMVAGILAFGAM